MYMNLNISLVPYLFTYAAILKFVGPAYAYIHWFIIMDFVITLQRFKFQYQKGLGCLFQSGMRLSSEQSTLFKQCHLRYMCFITLHEPT